jgi:hypothetical protein
MEEWLGVLVYFPWAIVYSENYDRLKTLASWEWK